MKILDNLKKAFPFKENNVTISSQFYDYKRKTIILNVKDFSFSIPFDWIKKSYSEIIKSEEIGLTRKDT